MKFGIQTSTQLKAIPGNFSCIEDVYKLRMIKDNISLRALVVAMPDLIIMKGGGKPKQVGNRWALSWAQGDFQYLWANYTKAELVARQKEDKAKGANYRIVWIPKYSYHEGADGNKFPTLL